MKYHIVLYFVLILLLNSCSNDMKVAYKQDKKLGTYQCFYPKDECQITLNLDGKKSYIDSIDSNCVLNRGLTQTIIDTKDLLDYYNLQTILKKSTNIRIIFFKKITTFPFFVRYFNKLPSNSIDILNYDMTESLKNISRKHLQNLEMLVRNSNLYSEELKKMNYRNCYFALDFSYWKRDKDLQTVPKSIDKFIVESNGVIKKENINFKRYPHIEYLPVIVNCQNRK